MSIYLHSKWIGLPGTKVLIQVCHYRYSTSEISLSESQHLCLVAV